jgi:hypothetical protein
MKMYKNNKILRENINIKKSRLLKLIKKNYTKKNEEFFENILNKKINNNLKIAIEKITNEDKAYIAGFLDGDGSLLTQIVKNPSYKYGFTIRYTIQFVQKKKNHNIML